ncbi:hypothetical protein Nocox_15825 [Nonomuraea coxensis DSM 45129]|uniref:Uncharacterized protein n=1 Tax=Nonomuraea coxensis DSM 45129 TaxID=1122611 RepID=A0ABX8U0W2_9ACTN|nr:hypothetical protein Nocox_15825 [Nonomuraea coxensis DSM 45129]
MTGGRDLPAQAADPAHTAGTPQARSNRTPNEHGPTQNPPHQDGPGQAGPGQDGPGDAGLAEAAGELPDGREVMPKRAAGPLPWPQRPGTDTNRKGEGRSQAAKTAAVAVGVVLLTLAGALIGVPAFRTTLDPVPHPGSVPPTPPAAALRRSPAATAPASATAPPVVDAAPVTTPPAPVTPPPSRLSPQPVATATTYPTTPGAVRPQAARSQRTRTARPRAIRPQPVRPRRSAVVMGTGDDSGTPAPTSTTTAPDTAATLTPAPQVPGSLNGQAAADGTS